MNIHVALYRWKPAISEKRIQVALAGIEDLADKVPGLLEVVATANSSKYGEEYTHVIFVRGENQESIDAYRAHPDHVRLAKEIDDMEEHGIGLDFVIKEKSNPEGLREIDRRIASSVIFSSDGKLLMGRKDPKKGGVYPNAWHIPGGGVEKGETLDQAVIREIAQEVEGLDLSDYVRELLPFLSHGSSAKTLASGERVWVNMEFNRFKVQLDKPAESLDHELAPGDDLVELRWFNRLELSEAEQIPGGREFFLEAGFMDR